MKKQIYLDNAATTRTAPQVLDYMIPYYSELYGNPSSIYELAVVNKRILHEARESTAALIGGEPDRVFFTGSGSEADNWALKTIAERYREDGCHIITSAIEHHAVLNTCKWLETMGCRVTYLESDEWGRISPDRLRAAIRPDTRLISVMLANNEIGTIEPVAELGAIAHEHGILFHTDAVQAYGHEEIDVKTMNIDMLSASAHKLNGPKGVGLLYAARGVPLSSFIHGGGQEEGKRAGTENVPGIAGFGMAARLAAEHMKERKSYECRLRDYVITRVLNEIPYTRVNGHRKERLSNNINLSFQFVEGETLLLMLDMKGICASTGSACNASSAEPSHVLRAIGLPGELMRGSLRLSISYETTKDDADYAIDAICEIVKSLREMSPRYTELIKNGRLQR